MERRPTVKRKILIACILALSLALALPALSQDEAPPPPPPGGHPPLPPVITALDVNGDGAIDAAEIASAPTELLTLDANGDGQLTKEELIAAPPSGGNGLRRPPGPPPGKSGKAPGQPPVPPITAALDANGDGTLEATEIANAAVTLKPLDTNGDGQLTFNELLPPPPPPPAGGTRTSQGMAGTSNAK
jgi:hypothetical protein